MPEHHGGGCLCRSVRYQIAGPLRAVLNCHCGMCLRFHGHYGAYTSALRENMTFVGAGRPSWYQSSQTAKRGFCPVCGASLFWEHADSAEIAIAAGSLDQPSGLMTQGHIFTADKADYYDIADGLPQHAGSKLWSES